MLHTDVAYASCGSVARCRNCEHWFPYEDLDHITTEEAPGSFHEESFCEECGVTVYPSDNFSRVRLHRLATLFVIAEALDG